MAKYRMLRFIALLLLLVVTAMNLTGCGNAKQSLSEKELIAVLPDTITTYDYDQNTLHPEIKELKVVKRNTSADNDFVECEILLQDQYVARRVYADLYLTYYEVGGWMVDTWTPYHTETVQVLAEPDPKAVRQLVDDLYSGSVETGTDDSQLTSGHYTTSFDVHEEHIYLTIGGMVNCVSTFTCIPATTDHRSFCGWYNELEYDIDFAWDVTGEWLLTEENAERPSKEYVGIRYIDPDSNWADVVAYYAFPAYQKDYYGSYTQLWEPKAKQSGVSAKDARLVVYTGISNSSVNLVFSADDVTTEGNSDDNDFSVVCATTQEIYDQWNNFPKSPDYEFPTADFSGPAV